MACLAAKPSRQGGISLHQLPMGVAKISGEKWGFTVSFEPYLKPEKAVPILQSADEVIAYAEKQSSEVQQNGVWIVTTDPDAYSETEKRILEEVKDLCRKEHIPLFICRGAKLPNGWERFDQ